MILKMNKMGLQIQQQIRQTHSFKLKKMVPLGDYFLLTVSVF